MNRAETRMNSNSRFYHLALLVASAWLPCMNGCYKPQNRPRPASSAAQMRGLKSKVIAQGQILPSGGIARLMGAPGDIVDEVLVQAGEKVTAGEQLVRLRSESVAKTQLEALLARRQEAQLTYEQTIQTAEQAVAAAKLKVARADQARSQLSSSDEVLKLAREQVEAAKRVMQQLQAIAGDSVTGSYVGRIEIDKQKVSVGEAELAYQQQKLAHQQAQTDANFALKAAQLEESTAQQALVTAKQSTALDVLDLEIETLKEKTAASRIVAPTDGMVLAVRTRRGEATTSFPLVEMGNTSEMVCEVEVNEMDAALVEPGQSVKLFSRAFAEPLTGTVAKKYSLVGRPQLRPLDPLARVDFRSITVVVELDDAVADKAVDWIQLQVEVEIAVGDSAMQTDGGSSEIPD